MDYPKTDKNKNAGTLQETALGQENHKLTRVHLETSICSADLAMKLQWQNSVILLIHWMSKGTSTVQQTATHAGQERIRLCCVVRLPLLILLKLLQKHLAFLARR